MIEVKEGTCRIRGTTEMILAELTTVTRAVHQMLEEDFDKATAEDILKDVLLFTTTENIEDVLEKKIKELEEQIRGECDVSGKSSN